MPTPLGGRLHYVGAPGRVAHALPSRASTDPAAIRRANLVRVMHALDRPDGETRGGLSAITGLTRSAVSSHIMELARRGLVREARVLRDGERGRPLTVLKIDGRHVAVTGMEINADYCSVMITDLAGDTLFHQRVATPRPARGTKAAVLSAAAGCLRRGMTAVPDKITVFGRVVIAVPGVVDASGTRVIAAPRLGWRNVDLATEIQHGAGAPKHSVVCERVSNLVALALARTAPFDRYRSIAYLEANVGIGSSWVVDGRLYRGSAGFAGEIGHAPIDIDTARACSCGSVGCLETRAGLDALIHAALPTSRARSRAAQLKRIVRDAASGRAATLRAIETTGRWLAIGAASLFNVIDPEVVVVGGYPLSLREWIWPALTEEFASRTRFPGRPTVSCLPSPFPEQGGLHGALVLARSLLLDEAATIPAITHVSP